MASILLAVLGAVLDVTPLVFRSGSMSPAIETGDLGVARAVPAADLRVGDVVSLRTSHGERVTHRVVSTEAAGDEAVLVLRGDANEAPDPERYTVTEADRLLFSVPKAGYVAAWLSGTGGVFLGGLLVGAVLLVLLARPRGSGGSTPGRRRADPAIRTSTLALGVLLVALPALALAPRPAGTLAAWDDPVAVSGASTTGYVVPAPTYSQTCTPGGSGTTRTVAYSWPANVAPLPPLSYDIVVSGITAAPATPAVSTSGGTARVTVSFSTSSTGNQNKVVTLTAVASPTGAAAWKSATTTWKFRTNGNSAAATCGETNAPVVAVTQPAGASYTRTALVSALGSCGTSPACGTRTDASLTTSTTQYRLTRLRSNTTMCWNGSAWSTGNCSTPWFAATVNNNSWSVGGTQATAYPTSNSTGEYTLTVQATDHYGNVSTTLPKRFTVT